MLVSDFEFELPDDRIAHAPVRPRDAARLLAYDRRTRSTVHSVFRELPRYLSSGDLLVLNNTSVVPCRLRGQRESGAKVEVLILERDGTACRGYVKPARKVRPGERVPLEGGRLVLTARAPGASLGPSGESADAGQGILTFDLEAPAGEDFETVLEAVGRAPLPPYIPRDGSEDVARDRAQYQTVFARHPGAVAAPTAGLHFTPELLTAIRAAGVTIVEVTLHVGAGTFAPIRVDRVEDHAMHREWYEVSPEVAAAVAATREQGGRVIAVGTTATRTLEASACLGAAADPDRALGGRVTAGTGSTDIFLYPGRPFRVVDAMITNFHLPCSTLLMLVAAFAGREEILRVYREAVAREYRFYSFGDAMLIL